MTVKYEYVCETCGHEYTEQRGASEPQFFSTCNKCGTGSYSEVKQTKLADELEVVPGPAPTEG